MSECSHKYESDFGLPPACVKCGEPMQNHNDTKCDMRYATECPICHLPSGGHNTILHRGIQEPSPRLMAEIDQAIKDHAPVAPVRKWEPQDIVGEIVFHESSSILDDDSERSVDVRFEDLSPEVQDALNGRKV